MTSMPRYCLPTPDFVTNALRNLEHFRPRLRLRQYAPLEAIGILGRYWVGYHPEWFRTSHKNRGYGVDTSSILARGRPGREGRQAQRREVKNKTFPVDKRKKTL